MDTANGKSCQSELACLHVFPTGDKVHQIGVCASLCVYLRNCAVDYYQAHAMPPLPHNGWHAKLPSRRSGVPAYCQPGPLATRSRRRPAHDDRRLEAGFITGEARACERLEAIIVRTSRLPLVLLSHGCLPSLLLPPFSLSHHWSLPT